MLYKIMSYPMHPHCGDLPMPCGPMRDTISALVTHRCTYALPRC